jgi:hypothetical protein
MKTQSGKQKKLISLIVLLLAILFFFFFDTSKHVPALAEMSPFSVDPFDAVGSFGIQLALLSASLSLVRVFRPYRRDEITPNQDQLILRGELTTVISIFVTLGADIVSMIRDFPVWVQSPGGRILAMMVAGMAVLTLFTSWLIFHDTNTHVVHSPSLFGVIFCFIGGLILVIYPSLWDNGIVGGIATALLGMGIFFIMVWALLMGISPEIDPDYEDFLDDLVAVYRWIKAHILFLNSLFQAVEKCMKQLWIRPILDWLDLRKHAWNIVVLFAILIGAGFALAEFMGEGASPIPGRSLIVMAVFIGIESAGVLLGYALLGRFLGIYRGTKSV